MTTQLALSFESEWTHGGQVMRRVSKHCHAVRMRWPLIRGTVSTRRLPGAIYRLVRL